ncbi:MAG TPA: Crp/Fnr family transcriptional regulator [Acidimicrobiia bacterium]|nr:Crp/Fnr family transcriptional regulator [Acidimicrobiia bacterium]
MRLEVLGRVPFFAGLKPQQLEAINRRLHTEGHGTDEPVYHAGFEADRLFVIATGVVKTTRMSLDGRESVIDILGPGDFFGALPALGSERYTDSAWTLSPCCLLVLGTAQFEWILEEFPAVARSALKAVSARLSDTQAALHRSASTVEQRVAAALLELADKLGSEWREGILVHAPISRDDLAALTGARTETVSRVLSKWRRDGLIDSGRRWVAVRDPKALAEVSDR